MGRPWGGATLGNVTNDPVLRRASQRRVVAGVCAGLARQWGVDPLLVRVAAIVAAVVTNGIAVLAYLGLWLVVPSDASTARTAASSPGRVLAALALLVAGAAVFVPESRGATVGFAMLAALSFVWYAVWRGRTRVPPPAPLAAAAPQWQQPPSALSSYRRPQAGATSYAYTYGGPRPRRVWPKVLLGVGAVWGGLAVADITGIRFEPVAYPAAALGVVGLALVALARPSRLPFLRPRGLVPLGLVLALVTMASLLPDTETAQNSVSQQTVTTASALPAEQVLPTGRHTVDLSGLTLDADRTATITQEGGVLTIVLPKSATTQLTCTVGMGQIKTPRSTTGGMDRTCSETYAGASGQHTLTLDVHLDAGQLEVRR